MQFGFQTEDMIAAKAAMLVYSIYRSRDKGQGPSGINMWSQIEGFARASAKRALTVGEFANTFKRKMACGAINPRWMNTGMVPAPNDQGEIIIRGDDRHFMPEIFECSDTEQSRIINIIYVQTTKIILLVRARLETEKPIEREIEKGMVAHE